MVTSLQTMRPPSFHPTHVTPTPRSGTQGEREVGAYADKEGKCVDCPTEGCMVCMNLNGTCTDCTTARGLVGGSCKQCVDKECLSCDGDVDTCIQ